MPLPLQTMKGRNEQIRNITIKLGYANSKIYKSSAAYEARGRAAVPCLVLALPATCPCSSPRAAFTCCALRIVPPWNFQTMGFPSLW